MMNGYGGYGGYGMHGNFVGGFFPMTMIFNLVVLIALIVVGVKLYKKYVSGTDKSKIFSILDEKYASGEITEEEYIKRRTILSNKKKK